MTDYLSPLSRPEAEGQIGPASFAQLNDIVNWLFGESCDRSFRIAPSLVTRSEAELLGTSYPRFACRCHLGSNGEFGFINARRLSVLSKAVKSWGMRSPEGVDIKRIESLVETRDEIPNPNQILLEQPCVGDSLLRAPEHLREKFHILEIDLGKAYGEGESLRGTPYVKHMKICGMCAQAACQMLLLLNEPFVKNIHGVSEITAIAGEIYHRADEIDGIELDLGGLTSQAIVDFLNDLRVGLSARAEIPTVDNKNNKFAEADEAEKLFGLALRSLVLSGFPVILPVDAGRLREIPRDLHEFPDRPAITPVLMSQNPPLPIHLIGATRSTDPNDENQVEKKRHHAIVVVGCSLNADNTFLVNDPGTVPFLTADLRQLMESRLYKTLEKKERMQLGARMYFSAVPDPVKLPLISIPEEGNPVLYQHGLINISDDLYRILEISELPRSVPLTQDSDRQFRLIELRKEKPECPTTAAVLPDGFEEAIGEIVRSASAPDGWYWVEQRKHTGVAALTQSIWMWDAAQGPASIETDFDRLVEDYLVGVAKKNLSGWSFVELRAPRRYRIPRSPKQVGVDQPAERPPWTSTRKSDAIPKVIKNSLISSYSAHGVFTAGNLQNHSIWREDLHCELYCFMFPDLEAIEQSLDHPNRETRSTFSAVETMSNWWDRGLVSQVAEIIDARFQSVRTRISGLASFVPEIAADSETEPGDASQAIKSLLFLYGLAQSLSRKGHPARTIEVVAGSRIETIFPGIKTGKEDRQRFFATRVSDKTIQSRLENNLTRLADELALISTGTDDPVYVFETEPGPLFAMRSLQTLSEIVQVFQRIPRGNDFFRLNADVSHWLLCGIYPELLERHLIRRVSHIHFSKNHPKCHFGDLPIEKPGEDGVDITESFLSNLFGEFKKERSRLESGFVSLEIEAAKEEVFVTRSIDKLREITGRKEVT